MKKARKFVWSPTGEAKALSLTSKAPLRWLGGKSKIAKWIISHFPEHVCYVEPFGGGASVLLQKEPSKVEVYNDLDGHVCEFFEVLRDKPWELTSLLIFMPHSRWLYESWKGSMRKNQWPENKIERVAMWLFLQSNAFSGTYKGGWGHGKTRNEAVRWLNITPRLIEAANRLKQVQIENKDFREVIETYDSSDTLFYCDPPYVQAKPDYYLHSFTMKDHEDLAQLLNKVQGKVCLSYYPHPFVTKAYDGWRVDRKEVVAWSAGITKTSKLKHRPKRTELLLMNYELSAED